MYYSRDKVSDKVMKVREKKKRDQKTKEGKRRGI